MEELGRYGRVEGKMRALLEENLRQEVEEILSRSLGSI